MAEYLSGKVVENQKDVQEGYVMAGVSELLNKAQGIESTKAPVQAEVTEPEVVEDTETVNEEVEETEATEEVEEVETTEEVEAVEEVEDKPLKKKKKKRPILVELQEKREQLRQAKAKNKEWEQRYFDEKGTQGKTPEAVVHQWADPTTDPNLFADQLVNHTNQAIETQRIDDSVFKLIEEVGEDKYGDAEKVFLEDAQADSNLLAKMRKSRNPAKFAYDYAVKKEALNEFESLDAIKAKMKAEILEEIESSKDKSVNKRKQLADSLPQATLTNVRGTTETTANRPKKTSGVKGILEKAQHLK